MLETTDRQMQRDHYQRSNALSVTCTLTGDTSKRSGSFQKRRCNHQTTAWFLWWVRYQPLTCQRCVSPCCLAFIFSLLCLNRLLHFIQNSDHLRKKQKQKFRKGLNHLKNLNITSKDLQCISGVHIWNITCIFPPEKQQQKHNRTESRGISHHWSKIIIENMLLRLLRINWVAVMMWWLTSTCCMSHHPNAI